MSHQRKYHNSHDSRRVRLQRISWLTKRSPLYGVRLIRHRTGINAKWSSGLCLFPLLTRSAYSFKTGWKLGEDVGLTGTIRRIVQGGFGDELAVRGTSKKWKGFTAASGSQIVVWRHGNTRRSCQFSINPVLRSPWLVFRATRQESALILPGDADFYKLRRISAHNDSQPRHARSQSRSPFTSTSLPNPMSISPARLSQICPCGWQRSDWGVSVPPFVYRPGLNSRAYSRAPQNRTTCDFGASASLANP